MYLLTNVDSHHVSSTASDSETYILDIHRTAAGLASIASSQHLALYDPAALSLGLLSSWPTAHGNVSSLRVFDDKLSLLCTTGEDGTVAVWDPRLSGGAAQVARFNGSRAPIISLACSANTQTIAVGTELRDHTASIFLWDVRTTPTASAAYHEVHSDDVTDLVFQPANPALLMSGSTDGLVNVYDTRVPDEDDLVIQTFNHNASIHHAAWLTSTDIVAVSHDEKFSLYDLAEDRVTGDAAQDFGDLRRDASLGCQYVANVLPKKDGSGAVLGAGSQDRQAFELVFMARGSQEWFLDKENRVGLPGAHGEEIVRAFCFYDEEQAVFTAGEDGNVKAWRPCS